MLLKILGTAALLWLILQPVMTFAADVGDGERMRHWLPQMAAIIILFTVTVAAIWR